MRESSPFRSKLAVWFGLRPGVPVLVEDKPFRETADRQETPTGMKCAFKGACQTMKTISLWGCVLPAFCAFMSCAILGGSLTEPVSKPFTNKVLSASAAGGSSGGTPSADGRYVLFISAATDLLPQRVRGGFLNAYVRDRHDETITLVTRALDRPGGGDGDSWNAAFSSDGRYIAFESVAKNLVTNILNGHTEIFLRDLQAGATTLVSVNPEGRGGNGASSNPQVSDDGRFVLFESVATDLTPDQTSGSGDIFVRDLQLGSTVLVSESTNAQATVSRRASMSRDGRWVLYEQTVLNGSSAFLLRDLVSRTTQPAILDASGTPPTSWYNRGLRLSADGSCLAFVSSWTNMVNAPSGIEPGALYWRDLRQGRNLLVATPTAGVPGDLAQFAISPGGQHIAYTHTNQVFVWDAVSQKSTLVSVSLQGGPAGGPCGSASLSADGQQVVFISNAQDLVAEPTSGRYQVYVRDLKSGITRLASSTPDAPRGSQADCLFPALSDDGRIVVFEALDTDLVTNDFNHATDVFTRELSKPSVELVSARDEALVPGTANQGGFVAPSGVSSNGQLILFTSTSADLVPGNTNGIVQVFLYDRDGRTNRLVSVDYTGTGAGNGASTLPAMTPDGRFVAFLSSATDLAASGTDTNGLIDVYVRDLTTGKTKAASGTATGVSNGAMRYGQNRPVISADGRYVAFLASIPAGMRDTLFFRDLVLDATVWTSSMDAQFRSPVPMAISPGGDLWFTAVTSTGGANPALYRFDLAARTNGLIAKGALSSVSMTPDGRTLAFWQEPLKLATVSPPNPPRTLLTFSTAGRALASQAPQISADGRLVAFVCPPGLLFPSSNIVVANVLQPGNFALVSINAHGTGGANASSDHPRISGDGRYVIFRSSATDLVPDVGNGRPNIYERDLGLGVTRVLSLASGADNTPDDWSSPPAISTDGRVVAFSATTDSLTDADLNNRFDVFAVVQSPAAATDSDHDGLPDDWELFYFGNLDHNAATDADGDGMGNLAEYQGGTHPLDRNSQVALRFEGAPLDGGTTLSWPATVLRTYQVQYKHSLSDAAWLDLPTPVARLGLDRLQVQGNGPLPAGQRFYRLSVHP